MIKIVLVAFVIATSYSASFSQQSAPLFQGVDQDNTPITSRDFLGKVVYIDLWASWCGPCRRETPHLKKVYKKYAADSSIVFMSIAVGDVYEDWKAALKQDKPTWLQLFDVDRKTFLLFGNELSIPRFIIIGKNGAVVNDDAPRPSRSKSLEKLLNEELEK